MKRLRPLFTHLLPISIGSTVLGIALILVAELGEVYELKVFGAGFISLGGFGIGTATGLADPRNLRIPDWLRTWRAVIGIAAGWLAILPVLIVLVMALPGVFRDGGERSALTLALGAVIIILMALAVIVSGVASLWRIYDASNDHPSEQGEAAEVGEGSLR